MSFFSILRRMISQNILGESYNALLGFGIIKIDILKYEDQ